MSVPTCGSGFSPPPPPTAPDAGQDGFVFYGVLLCELAVVMIALGSDVQKFALTKVEKSRRCLCIPCDFAIWLLGLITYFGGNSVYTLALAFAPASLCAALMATVVVANALLSRLLLGERLQRCDYHGGVCIMLGIAVTASFAPYVTVEYTATDISGLLLEPSGLLGLAHPRCAAPRERGDSPRARGHKAACLFLEWCSSSVG
ncbi:MAG: hypothetical protein SGPRY_009690 [Prymnesium sp.]